MALGVEQHSGIPSPVSCSIYFFIKSSGNALGASLPELIPAAETAPGGGTAGRSARSCFPRRRKRPFKRNRSSLAEPLSSHRAEHRAGGIDGSFIVGFTATKISLQGLDLEPLKGARLQISRADERAVMDADVPLVFCSPRGEAPAPHQVMHCQRAPPAVSISTRESQHLCAPPTPVGSLQFPQVPGGKPPQHGFGQYLSETAHKTFPLFLFQAM